MALTLIAMHEVYNIGDKVRLKENCKTKMQKFTKGEELEVVDVEETKVYLYNERGNLTIHRLIDNLIEKI